MTSNSGHWTRDDFPASLPDAEGVYGPSILVPSVRRDLAAWLNAHYPKPQPYDQGGVRGADSLLYRAERERDAAVARAEAAEARTAPAVTRDDIEKAIRYEFLDWEGQLEARISRAVNQTWNLVSGADPAVHVVRESDISAVGIERDKDQGWTIPGRGWGWVRYSTAEELRKYARENCDRAAACEAVARAIESEQAVDPVEELAEQIETATRAAIRQACDDLAGVVPALDPLAVEQAMEVTAASRKVAAHVLGQEATR